MDSVNGWNWTRTLKSEPGAAAFIFSTYSACFSSTNFMTRISFVVMPVIQLALERGPVN
ncbi:hypothetical protein FALCPG4_017757 [Fusarium falciforme]